MKHPKLNEGEIYIGAIITADGTRNHHLILLPGENESANFADATTWAQSIGGELPDRVEGALLFAHAKEHFTPEWYWTREQRASYSDFAWYQSFDNGNQNFSNKGNQLRARAVRRVQIGEE
jgi:hypothetical protein